MKFIKLLFILTILVGIPMIVESVDIDLVTILKCGSSVLGFNGKGKIVCGIDDCINNLDKDNDGRIICSLDGIGLDLDKDGDISPEVDDCIGNEALDTNQDGIIICGVKIID